MVRFHYQWILLHDFLPTIIHSSVWSAVVPKGVDNLVLNPPDLKFYMAENDNPFMPLEFFRGGLPVWSLAGAAGVPDQRWDRAGADLFHRRGRYARVPGAAAGLGPSIGNGSST